MFTELTMEYILVVHTLQPLKRNKQYTRMAVKGAGTQTGRRYTIKAAYWIEF